MIVSVGIVALNEEAYLPWILEDLLHQNYDHKQIEILLVDSGSTDRTKELMQEFAARYGVEFSAIQILDNPKKVQAAGWNTVFKFAKGEVIIRLDAHARVLPDFVSQHIAWQSKGEYVTGGLCQRVMSNESSWGRVLLALENSLFGSSFGRKINHEKSYVKTLSHTAYRGEVIQKVGGFNEHLQRTEDNEFHYRIRRAGYKLLCDPKIVSYHYARSSLKNMVRQKYGNGHWVGLTLGVCPACISLYHLVPFVFVLGIVFTTILAAFSVWQLSALMWAGYALFALFSTVAAVFRGEVKGYCVIMPILFLLLHVSYGVGTLIGIVEISQFRKKLK